MKKSLLLLALLSPAAFATNTDACTIASESEVISLFDKWNNALQTGDAKIVAATYMKDAVLLPTVSNKVRLTDDERIDYFEHFLQKKPKGKVKSRIIRTGCNKAIDTGVYTFKFADKSTVTARYTFTYAWDGKEWKISSHHSSAMPET